MFLSRKRNIGLPKVPRSKSVEPPLTLWKNKRSLASSDDNIVYIPGRGSVSLTTGAVVCGQHSIPTFDTCSISRPAVQVAFEPNAVVPFVATRNSAPVVITSCRASATKAVEVCASNDTKIAAILSLERDKVANSARASRETHWRTWCRMHVAWFGAAKPVLPLTTEKIKCLASMFKAGDYSSFENYASRAKSEHISRFLEHQVPWSLELSEEIRSAKRSVLRGVGGPRQSMPVDVDRIKALGNVELPTGEGGPIGPVDFIVVGAFFMTREIEISCAGRCHVFEDEDNLEVTWSLPVSKCDPRAIGTTRTWGCVCSGDMSQACPYHSMRSQLARVDCLALRLCRKPNELPLFPDDQGNEISKLSAVECINHLVTLTGSPVISPQGKPLYGGHSMRTGGAVALSALGLDLQRIECMARWQSPMILHYARNAPLKSITSEFKLRKKMASAEAHAEDTARHLASVQRTLDALFNKLNSVQLKDDLWASRISDLEAKNSCVQYVLNLKGGMWHKTCMHNSLCQVSTWRTNCGWLYMNSNHELKSSLPDFDSDSAICGRCLPTEKLLHDAND